MLLTDDGKWLHNVTSPKHHCHKRYIVETAEPIETNSIEAFKNGIVLKDEPKPTLPATLTPLESPENNVNLAEVIISEGRYHQVKRMFGHFNNKVIDLH